MKSGLIIKSDSAHMHGSGILPGAYNIPLLQVHGSNFRIGKRPLWLSLSLLFFKLDISKPLGIPHMVWFTDLSPFSRVDLPQNSSLGLSHTPFLRSELFQYLWTFNET